MFKHCFGEGEGSRTPVRELFNTQSYMLGRFCLAQVIEHPLLTASSHVVLSVNARDTSTEQLMYFTMMRYLSALRITGRLSRLRD